MEKQIRTHNGNTIELEKLARVAHVRGRPVSRLVDVIAKTGERGTFRLDYAIGVLDYRITMEPARAGDLPLVHEKIIAMPQLFDVLCSLTIPGYERTVLAPAKKEKAKAEVTQELKDGILAAVKATQDPSQAPQAAPSEEIETPVGGSSSPSPARRIVRPKAAAKGPKKSAPKSKAAPKSKKKSK